MGDYGGLIQFPPVPSPDTLPGSDPLKIRLPISHPASASRWRAHLNGAALEPVQADSVPRDPHPALQGTSEMLAAWRVPVAQSRPDLNAVDLTLEAGDTATIVFAELLLP